MKENDSSLRRGMQELERRTMSAADRLHKSAALSVPLTGTTMGRAPERIKGLPYEPEYADLRDGTREDVDAYYKSVAREFVKAAGAVGEIPGCLSADQNGDLSVADLEALASDVGYKAVLEFGLKMNRFVDLHTVHVDGMEYQGGRISGDIKGTAAWLDFETKSPGASGREHFEYTPDGHSGVSGPAPICENPAGPDPGDGPGPGPGAAGQPNPGVPAYARMRRMLESESESGREPDRDIEY